MRYYTLQHNYYCGVDLHARTMYLCVLDGQGVVKLHKNVASEPGAFLRAIEPYREGLVVGVECMFAWYWLSDLCEAEGIKFVLGHALYMRSIHGAKSKNDKLDSQKLAMLLRGGMFPQSYVYPRQMRSTRDLMRRRLFFVRRRAELLSHVQILHHQYNLASPGRSIAYKGNREGLEESFTDSSASRLVQSDVTMIEHYTKEIVKLEWFIGKAARKTGNNAVLLGLLKAIPGIGDILSLTLLYEIQDILRFPTVQQFSSYARLVKPEKTSAGKKAGGGGKKIGNPHLKWAFGEATALMLSKSENANKYYKRLQSKGSNAKAMSTLAHRMGRAVYYMILRKEAFNEQKFFAY